VTEAPASACFKFRVGNMELLYTLRGVDDVELQQRMTATLPTLQDIMEACEARAAQRVAERAAAQAAQAQQAQHAPADLPALLQQAVQQALAAQGSPNGQAHGTPPPAPPPHGDPPSPPEPDDQQPRFCSIRQVQMEQKQNARGTFYGHWLADEQRHCNGRRNGRR